jgi:hypothetical protein
MPIPALAGIPWIASVVVGVFSSVIAFFATYLGRWIAIMAVFVTVVTALTYTFALGITELLIALQERSPSQLALVLSWFLPTNFSACLGAIWTARIMRWVYDWNIKIASAKLKAAK